VKYLYSLIRFVPDPIRGEAVNLGAIVGSDATHEWDIRLVSNRRRAISIDDAKALPGVAATVATIEDQVEAADGGGASPVSERWLTTLASEYRHVLQFTPPAPMVAATPADALDLIFGHVVLDPARAERSFRTKHRALAVTRGAYAARDIPAIAIAEKALVNAAGYSGRLDFLIHNGAALQLAQSWSFELPGQDELIEEVHAWAWVTEAMRRGDARARLDDGRRIDIPPDVEVGVVFIPPRPEQRAPAFDEARRAFDQVRARAVDWEHADELARDAAYRLARAELVEK
jgi:hypothetical protein